MYHTNLGGGYEYVLFSSLFGEDFQFDEHIFQMGWFNHQPVIEYYRACELHLLRGNDDRAWIIQGVSNCYVDFLNIGIEWNWQKRK